MLEAENGRIALDRVAESRPGVILLDLMMPEMDGFQFVEAALSREDLSAETGAQVMSSISKRRPVASEPSVVA